MEENSDNSLTDDSLDLATNSIPKDGDSSDNYCK